MRKMRQVLALLLTAVMIVTVPTAAFGTPISDGVQAKGLVDIVQSVHNEGKGIYKLTATASTHVANALTFAVSMSYDNTVVQPVRGDGQILNIEDESREVQAFKKDCGIDPNDEYAAYFNRIGVRWVVDDTNHRTAFTLTMATTNYENGTSIATGMVMGEFYFKIKEGKGLNKGSFRIETPDYADSQISRLFGDVNEQDAITLGLKTGVGQEIEKLLYGSKQYEDSLKASLTYDNNGEDVVKSLEISGDTNQTIQVPALGATNTLDLDATAKGIYGDTMLGVGVVWAMSDTISGVTIDPETGVITVDYTAQSGNLVVTATAIGTTVSDTVNISIQRGGTALAKVTLSQASIEVAGGEAGAQTITAAAFDQYGAPCSGGTWSVAGSDAGNVTIDPASGVVTVKSKAKVGTYRVTVTKGGACAEATFQVTHTASIAKSLTILKGSADCASDAISKPVSGAAKAVTYTAKALDQFDEVMERAQVVWSVKGTLPSNVTQKDGTIGVPANAVNGQFSLVATVKDSGISDTCQITITSINGDWSSITATTAAVAYGAKNSDLITGTASTQLKYSLDGVGEKFLTGAYAVVSGEAIQGAGTKKVRVNFTADNSESNGEYKNVVLTKEFNVTIAKKPIAVRVTDTDKIYGSANPAFGCTYSSDTLVGTDTEEDLAIAFNCEADATTDVGNTTITAISNSTNYDVTVRSGTLTIKPKKLTVGNGTIAITKVYDGTTGAGLLTGGLVHNGVNGDQLTVTASAPTAYPNAQVGAGYSATFTITLGGSKAANYTLGEEGAAPITTGTGTLTSAAITPKALTITGATVEDKAYVYNGSKAATIAGVTFSGLMAGETLALGTDYKVTNATFASESVGQNIQVTATIALTTTEKAKHYSLADSALQTTGNIVKSTTEITGIEGKAQVLSSDYDKKSETTYTFDLKTLQIGATDILNIRYGAVSIAENTGGMIATNPTPTIENGILTFTVVPKAKDTTAKIAVVIKSDNYGDSRATITVTSMDKALVSNGMVFKDGEATYNGKTQTYEKATASGEGVNTVKPLLYTYTTENGQLKDNKPWGVGTYRVKAVYEDDKNYGEKTATFTITKASLRITAHDNTIVYGEMPTAKGVTYGGFVNGETETVLEGTLGYQYSYNQYGNVGDHYTITPTGYRAKNYEISYVPGNLTVRIKPLQVAAGTYQVAKAYDGTTTAGTPSGALSLTGLENNDVVTVTVGDVGAYKDKKASKNQSVPLSNLTLSGEKRGNYQLENTTFDLGTAVITPKVISNVTKGDYTITKEYDGTTTAGTPSGNLTMTEVIAGDQLGIATTVGTYDNKDVGTAHSVVVTLGNLTGDDCENYSKNSTLTTVTITNAAITRAAYKYTVSESQEIKEGSTLSAITVAPTRSTGKNGESISMVTRWYTDSGRTIEATDHVFDSLKGGEEITLYWSGKTSDTNYQQTAKTGAALFKIVEGNTQTFAEGFTEDVSKTYGDTAYTKGATLTVGTGTITYASSNKDVATVEATTGEVTLHKAGKAKITATAAAVPGAFVATEISYKLNVEQREVGLTWSGDSNLTYDNKAKAVIATVNNIVGGDTVNVTVQGGNAVNAGVYTAKGTALSNPNYKLPDSPEKSYTIAKADREFQIDHTEKILVGDELYFTIKGTTETDLDKSFQPAFKSSTTTVAAVNNSGRVKALGDGEAIITVTVEETDNYKESASKTCVVKVCTAPIIGIDSVVSSTSTDKLVGEVDGRTIRVTGFVSEGSGITVTPILASGVSGKGNATTTVIAAGDMAKGGTFTAVFGDKEVSYKVDTASVEKLAHITIDSTTKSAVVASDAAIEGGDKKALEEALKAMETKAENFESAIVKQVVEAAQALGGDVKAWVKLDIEATAYTTTSMSLSITPKLVLEWKEDGKDQTKETKLTNLSNAITVSVKLPSGFSQENLFAKHDLGGGVFEYLQAMVSGGIATWKQGSFSDVTLVSDGRKADITYEFEDGSKQAVSYTVADLGKKLPTDVKSGNTFDGWTINKKDYTQVTENFLTKLSGSPHTAKASFLADSSGGGSTGGGGGGGSIAPSETLYHIELAKTENGTVIIGNGKAVEGAKTTIQAMPKKGYMVDKITVTGKDGKEIHVTKNVDGTFSFIQPKGDVVVNVKFIERKPGGKVVDDKILAEIVALFDDVSQEDWFLEPVAYVVSKGVMKGISTNEFGPTGSMTRGMVTTVLYRIENAPTAPETGPFTDVNYDKYYGDAIKWCVQQEIVKGFEGGKFGPELNVTRMEFAQMMCGYAKALGYDTTVVSGYEKIKAFKDYDQIADWSKNAMAFMVENGLLEGNKKGEINAAGVITRSEAATILTRFLTDYKK